jgi:hypothetical protein
MPVAPLPSGPARARPPGPRHTDLRRRPRGDHTDVEPLTVTFEITLSGDNRFAGAAEVFEALRQVADRLGTARVSMHPRPAPALASIGAPAPGRVGTPPAEEPRVPRIDPSQADEVVVLPDSREVRLHGQNIAFTRVEFDLLYFLAAHPRQVFTREQLLQRVWGYSQGGHRTVDVHIRRLRAKLLDRPVATTVRGVGYRLSDSANVRVVRIPG